MPKQQFAYTTGTVLIQCIQATIPANGMCILPPCTKLCGILTGVAELPTLESMEVNLACVAYG